MIIYRDTDADARISPPAWLIGAADLQRRDGLGMPYRWWGIGDGYLLSDAPDAAWTDLDLGWQVRMLNPLDPARLRRHAHWCDVADAFDLHARRWAAPVLLSASGEPVYRVTYGGNWLPKLSPLQERADAIARAARAALLAGAVDPAPACQWTAELLSITHHIAPDVFASLALIDDALILSTLSIATGLRLTTIADAATSASAGT